MAMLLLCRRVTFRVGFRVRVRVRVLGRRGNALQEGTFIVGFRF